MTPTEGRLEGTNESLVYDALSHGRRRCVLRRLNGSSGPLSLRDLAEAVARWERDDVDGAVDEKQVERVQASLHHTHVPKLADAGIVRYEQGDELVELTQSVSLEAVDVLDE